MVAAPDPETWLPPLAEPKHCGGDWDAYCEQLYEIFKSDFVRSTATFNGKRVAVAGKPYPDGKHACFWHLTSEGKIEADRTPDLRKCERLRWARAILDEALSHPDRVRSWVDSSRGQPRHQIALADFSYLIVLAGRGDYFLLITAYPVEHEHSRTKLRKQFEAALAISKLRKG